MALQNPSNLYSANNVVLDNTPFTRIALQQKARRQALDDSLYKHYSELPSKINPAGMRSQDNAGFNNRVAGMYDFWDANKGEIMQGGQKQHEFNQMIQGARQYVQESKDAGKFGLQSGKDFFEGKHRHRKRDLEIIAAHEKPLDDPGHYKNPDIKMPYSYNDYSIAAKPFDANAQMAFDKSLLGKRVPSIDPNTPPKFNTDTFEVTYNTKLKPEEVYQIAEQAAREVDPNSNPSAYNYFEDKLEEEDAVRAASQALSKLAGTQVIAETPQQMAAGLKAEQYMNFSKPLIKKDVAAVNEYKEGQKKIDFERSLRKMGLSDAYIRGRMRLGDEFKRSYTRFKTALNAGEEDKILNTFIDKMVETGTKTPYLTHKGQVFRDGTISPLPMELADKYTINTGDEKNPVFEKPKGLFISKDKQTVVPIYYDKVENGKAKIDPLRSSPVPVQNFKIDLSKLLLTKSKTGAEVVDAFTGDDGSEVTEYSTGTTEKKQGNPPPKKVIKDPLGLF